MSYTPNQETVVIRISEKQLQQNIEKLKKSMEDFLIAIQEVISQ